MEQIMWTVDFEEDIESDLSVFHRVDDPMTLDGPRYFRLALRLAAYTGVIAARAAQEEQDRNGGRHAAPAATPTAPAGAGRPARVDDGAALAMLADGWVEHETERAPA